MITDCVFSLLSSNETDLDCRFVSSNTLTARSKTAATMVNKGSRTQTRSGRASASNSASTNPGDLNTSVGSRPAREQKKDLANLNDRLANYINTVRTLEIENEGLVAQLNKENEKHAKEIDTIKSEYIKQVDDLQAILDQVSTEKAKVQIDFDRLQSNNHDLIAKNDLLAKQLKVSDKISEENQRLTKDLDQLILQLTKLKKDLEQAEQEKRNQQKTIKANQTLLEQETLRAVTLENKVKGLTEQIHLNERLFNQRLAELKQQYDEEYADKLDREVDNELAVALAEQKRELEKQNELFKEKLRERVEQENRPIIDQLNQKLNQKANIEKDLRHQLQDLQATCEKFSEQSRTFAAVKRELQDKIADLENQLNIARTDKLTSVSQKEEEIKKLEDAIKAKEEEYAELFDVKNALSEEIEAYRRLLEGEERRHNNLSSTEGGQGSPKTSRLSVQSPRRIASSRKRRRIAEEEENVTDTHVETFGDGPVVIEDFDQKGNFVKLSNPSSEDVALGGWTIKRVAGDQEVTFKISRSVLIKAGAVLTLWSVSSGATHDPPNNIVIKGNWPAGDRIDTVLLNPEGVEIAHRNTLLTVRKIKKRLSDHLNGGDLRDSEKCLLM